MKKTTSIKTTAPRLRRVYCRERAFDEINQKRDYSLIWIEGQPGCGKTTLINSYLENNKCDYLWYRISETDNNLDEFLYHFLLALRAFLPKTSQSLKMLSLPFKLDTKALFLTIFSELHQNIVSPFCLIFDDFHLISNNNFHEVLVESIITENTNEINTFIVSRYKPPPVYSRLRARQQFSQLSKQYLDWSEDEVVGLVHMLSDNSLSTEFGKACFNITDGWVSGVILLMEMLKEKSGQTIDITSLDREFLFAYLASEIFESIRKETQILLMKASFLNEVKVERDKCLLNDGNLKIIFENLCNRNYFTTSSVGKNFTYTFHPLFKEFLQKKSYNFFNQDEIVFLKKKIAYSLYRNAEYVRAIELYLEIENWEKAAYIIIQYADTLLSQGKRRLILHLIGQFSHDAYDRYTWLRYWEATCYLAINPNKAYPVFLSIYNTFQHEKDFIGEYNAICGIIESIIFSFDYYERLVPWIDTVTENYDKGIKPKGIELLARLSANMHTALLFSQPSHKDLKKWEKNVRYLMKGLKITLNHDHRVLVGVNLFYQYLWNGEKYKANKILASTKIDNIEGTVNPVSQGAWCVMAAINSWMNGDASTAKKAADEGMKLAKESGIYFWFNLLLFQKAYACLINEELDQAQKLLRVASEQPNNDSQLLASMYYDVCGLLDYLRNDLDSALENSELCMIEIDKMKMPVANAGYRLGLVEVQIARGEYEHARNNLRLVSKACRGTPSDIFLYRCMLLETHLALETSEYIAAKNHMQRAMALAQRKGFESHPWWNAKNISILYEFALVENINTDYVIHCIKKRNLNVNINLIEFENWDWQVKIYALGKFTVVVNQTPLILMGKSRRKPLTLLKAILALGIWRINQSHLAEKLWPDADGAVAQQAFYTTVHRLRRLIGPKSILVKDGYIGLNPDVVWVDITLAHFYADKIANAIHTRQKSNKQLNCIDNLLSLYKGKFLEHEQDEVWCYHCAKVLHCKIISSLTRYASYLSEQQQYENALALLKRITQLDILDEKIYKDQVTLLISLNRYPEALTVYNECRGLLSQVLGIMPSDALSKLVDDRMIKTPHQP